MDPGAASLAGCAAAGGSERPSWIGWAALLTLLALLVTGVYLFAQHYLRKIRRARSESAS
jgi:MYXO-CTERM domain-containing protein